MTGTVSSPTSLIGHDDENTNNAHKLAYKRIALVRNWLLLLPFIGFGLQMLIDPGRDNAVASVLATSGSFLVIYDAFTHRRLTQYPLSTLITLGFGVILNLAPLLLTAVERKPITYNLNLPAYTFLHCLLITGVVLLAHGVYRNLRLLQAARSIIQGVLLRMRMFDQIAFKEVWLFAIIGFVATYLQRGDEMAAGAAMAELPSSPLIKFIEGFRFLSAIPVVYYLQSIWTQNKSPGTWNVRNPLLTVSIYFVLISFVAIATNTRSVLLAPLSTLFFGLIVAALYGLFRLQFSRLIGITLVLLLLFPLASDLTSAMRMARAFRGDVSPVDLALITFENLQDRDELRRFQESVSQSYETSTLWDMSYYNNEMLNRVANIKVVDQSLELDTEIGEVGRQAMLDYHIARLISVLPMPLFTALGFPPELKTETISLSWGDKHLNTALGYPTYTSFRVSHFSGTGMSAFRYAYLLVLLPGLVVVFTFADSHCIPSSRLNAALPLFSIIGFASLLSWFIFPIQSDLNAFYLFAGREFWQPVLLLFGLRWLVLRL